MHTHAHTNTNTHTHNGTEDALKEDRLPLEYVDAGVGHFRVHAEDKANLRHRAEHILHLAHVCDTRVAVRGCTRRVELRGKQRGEEQKEEEVSRCLTFTACTKSEAWAVRISSGLVLSVR